ncbi:hypothetical protein ASPWEDRAFT_35602 [Aspergillus wentii DTO 134E9]|uniref:FAD-dependent urate hydroxylase HpyO/Asp monooxygenase CreE-like FAD/NAD(P)-binding domain-containing protein n=1 Tax=Aspergillus wentii DTO 134E9 TaxID=1073089 RepID=A0A1L9RST8_ASPWE|nr:uncharacterized protein ASPWEDRAFT_35602 [Aspergillus wentii DTO 134E9]OJJ38036.1 hypothetical protein ASPWEDRAFT_35602 [Aspergillus wentii DTO 134E9]
MPQFVPPSPEDVVIVGGGASGLAVVLQLVERLRNGKTVKKVTLVDKNSIAGPGLAYSQDCAGTILNMPKQTMGLFANNQNHFNEWRQDPNLDLYPARTTYGEYLQAMWTKTVQDAEQMGARFSFIADEVDDIDRLDDGTFSLSFMGKTKKMSARNVVLAIGNFTSVVNTHLLNIPGFFPSPWPTTGLKTIPTDAPVIIIGSRLSAIDAATNLQSNGHQGSITFMSRSGCLPKVQGPAIPFPRRHNLYTTARHAQAQADNGGSLARIISDVMEEISQVTGNDWRWLLQTHECPLEEFEADLESARAGTVEWQTVLKATAPIVERYWRSLETHDKKLFMDKFYSSWMRYRHGTPIQNAEKILRMMKKDQLNVVKGKDVQWNGETFIAKTSSGDIKAPYVIEATGQECRVAQMPSPLIQSTLRKGLATPHPFGGLEVDFDNLRASPGLYAIGSLTQGTHFYVSSVDRIADHARRMADELTGEPLARSMHVALFLGGDAFSHLMASKLVPQILAEGHMPFVFLLPSNKSSTKNSSFREHQLAFLEQSLMKQHVIPFLNDTPGKNAAHLTVEKLKSTYGILVQEVDDRVSATLEKHHVDVGLSLQCTHSQTLPKDIVNYFSSSRRLLNVHLTVPPTITSSSKQPTESSPYCLHDVHDHCDQIQKDLRSLSLEYSKPMLHYKNDTFASAVELAMKAIDHVSRGKEIPETLKPKQAKQNGSVKETGKVQANGSTAADVESLVNIIVKSYASPEEQGIFHAYLSKVVKEWHEESCRGNCVMQKVVV